MSETKHMPLPWVFDEEYKLIECANGDVIELRGPMHRFDDETRANYEFIVRAANSHYELLEALKMCSDFINRASGGEGMTEGERWALLEDARDEAEKAIAKAEGREE